MTNRATTEKRQYKMNVRAQRSEATATRIRESALEQFLAHAYEEVTLAEVAETAKVTVATLIAHFGRKEDLFIAACQDGFNRIAESRSEAPVGDHRGAVRNLFENYEPHGKSILHLLAEEDRAPAVRAITDLGRERHRELVQRVFESNLKPLRGTRREQLVVQLIVVTDVLTWKLMRLDLKLSRGQAEATLVQMIDALTGKG
jgi:AcrR family transcriptional regulator